MSREAGAIAESQVALFLAGLGYRIIERNFFAKTGEIDLIARDGETVVFVEVKSRSSSAYGLAQEFVGRAKRRKIIKTAMVYIQRRALDCPMRFDVVAVAGGVIEHIPSAFDAGG